MGDPVGVVRQFIEGGATGGLSGCGFCPVILKLVILGDQATRVVLHLPCSLCLCPSGSCLGQSAAQGLIHNLAFRYSLSFRKNVFTVL